MKLMEPYSKVGMVLSRIFNCVARVVLLVLVSAVMGCNAEHSQEVDIDNEVILEGTVTLERGFDAAGEEERFFLLRLASPLRADVDFVELLGGDGPSGPVAVTTLDVQLAGGFDAKAMKDAAGRAVRVSGRLFPGHTAHHHRQLLLGVKKWQVEKKGVWYEGK
jgi:hypothetical protein